MQPGFFDWRAARAPGGEASGGSGGAGGKKGGNSGGERNQPHWRIAKELGIKKKGSDTRRKKRERERKQQQQQQEQEDHEDHEVVEQNEIVESQQKQPKRDREAAVELTNADKSSQASYLETCGVVGLTGASETLVVAVAGGSFGARCGAAYDSLAGRSGAKDWVSGQGKGAPTVIVIVPSADRGVAVIASLREHLQKITKKSAPAIAKLWARHFSVAQHVEYLATHAVAIAVGTPNRLLALIADGSLKLNRLALVAVDCLPNAKQQNIFTINEVKHDVVALLKADALLTRFNAQETKLCLL